jgi:hypothetical protein
MIGDDSEVVQQCGGLDARDVYQRARHYQAQRPRQGLLRRVEAEAEPARDERRDSDGDRGDSDGVSDDQPPAGLPGQPRFTGYAAGDLIHPAGQRIARHQFSHCQTHSEHLKRPADHERPE